MTNLTLVVVTSLLTAQSPEWKDVPRLLGEKHENEARVELLVHPNLTNATVFASLAKVRPTHVAFVMRPEEVDFPTVVALKRGMRDLDEDPYDDAKWGIVTGPTAADARRIATSREPRELRTALATTGVDDNVVPGPLYCISDAYPEGCWRVKSADGTITRHCSSNDISHVFAEGWNTLDPDFVLTSSHASQRNLEMPFSRGNIVPRDGRFHTLPDETLIDYASGQAKSGSDHHSSRNVQRSLAAPRREKVWLAAGNCLIADNLRPGDNMVMTALGFGKVNQFVGYMSTTWFGEIGWGTLGNFNKGMSLVDAYFAANEQLIRELEETVSNANAFRPRFASAEDYDRLVQEARRYPFAFKDAPAEARQKFIGRLWDRDATVFYGDPLQRVALKPVR